jgi:hypothetical protein
MNLSGQIPAGNGRVCLAAEWGNLWMEVAVFIGWSLSNQAKISLRFSSLWSDVMTTMVQFSVKGGRNVSIATDPNELQWCDKFERMISWKDTRECVGAGTWHASCGVEMSAILVEVRIFVTEWWSVGSWLSCWTQYRKVVGSKILPELLRVPRSNVSHS